MPNLVQILGNRIAKPVVASSGVSKGIGGSSPKISKACAGYVYRPGVDYRCSECWQFVDSANRCLSHGKADVINDNGYCTYWQHGQPVQSGTPKGALTKVESGYGENPNGTKCRRCINFDPAGYCKKVDERSPGDTPGKIHPDACCSLQTPKKAA